MNRYSHWTVESGVEKEPVEHETYPDPQYTSSGPYYGRYAPGGLRAEEGREDLAWSFDDPHGHPAADMNLLTFDGSNMGAVTQADDQTVWNNYTVETDGNQWHAWNPEQIVSGLTSSAHDPTQAAPADGTIQDQPTSRRKFPHEPVQITGISGAHLTETTLLTHVVLDKKECHGSLNKYYPGKVDRKALYEVEAPGRRCRKISENGSTCDGELYLAESRDEDGRHGHIRELISACHRHENALPEGYRWTLNCQHHLKENMKRRASAVRDRPGSVATPSTLRPWDRVWTARCAECNTIARAGGNTVDGTAFKAHIKAGANTADDVTRFVHYISGSGGVDRGLIG